MTHIETLRAQGIRRVGSPKRGFRYQQSNGKPLPAGELERIEALKIPPAWTDVLISAKDFRTWGGTLI